MNCSRMEKTSPRDDGFPRKNEEEPRPDPGLLLSEAIMFELGRRSANSPPMR